MHTAIDKWKRFLPTVARKVGMKPYPGHRLFLVQHLREETLRLVETLLAYVEIDVVVGVSYSTQPHVVEALRELGVRVVTPAWDEMETALVGELARSVERSERDGRKIILQETGGHAAPLLGRHFAHALGHFAGCVEVSKQGLVRAREAGVELALPHLNVADSTLKRVESLLVGDSVVLALDTLLRTQGWTLAGRRVLVAGYGWVGRSTCRALRRKDTVVGVYDPDPLKLVEAKIEGFLTPSLRDWLPQVSLVVGTAGARSVTAGVIALLPDGAAIASGSSRDVEIDLEALRKRADGSEEVSDGVRRFRMRDGRSLYLLNDGYPVNFVGSRVPDEVVELIYAAALVLVHELATGSHPAGIATIDPALEALPALAWLEMRDPHFRALAAA